MVGFSLPLIQGMLYLSEENLSSHHLTLIVSHFVANLKREANLSAKQCTTRRKKKSLCFWYSYPPGSESGDQSIGSVFCAAVWIFFHFDETIFLENKEQKPTRVGSWGSFQAAL